MMLTTGQMDRACGVLLGQACGDALGVPYEGGAPRGADQVATMKGGGYGPYSPGEWSDDTQMAACIARVTARGESLTETEQLDEVAYAFLEWRRAGATDIGNQTAWVLENAKGPQEGAAARLTRAAADYFARRPENAAGNGALMRTSVVGLIRLEDRDQTARAARLVAELTHADPLAGDSAVLWSEAVRIAVTERRLDLEGGLDLLPAHRRDQWASWIRDADRLAPGYFTHNGFTVTALQAAWSAIRHTPIPEELPESGSYPCLHLQRTLQEAVRIGHDTDTVSAIAGGLLGAYWGQSAVPLTWVRKLHGWPHLRARDLVRLAALTAKHGNCDADGWPSTPHLTYGEPARPAVRHPMDPGVFLGTELSGDQDATAIVSLFRRGRLDVPAPGIALGNHVEARLIDSEDPEANHNLGFVLADSAALVHELRQQGHEVLVHCVRGEQRTPSVALAYAVQLGATPADARRQLATALPASRRWGRLWDMAPRAARPDPDIAGGLEHPPAEVAAAEQDSVAGQRRVESADYPHGVAQWHAQVTAHQRRTEIGSRARTEADDPGNKQGHSDPESPV